MKRHSFAREIPDFLPFTLSRSQSKAVALLDVFFSAEAASESVFMLCGYAGTGKTTLVAALVACLNQAGAELALLAPTGRAARRLSSACGLAAGTIHRSIYRSSSAMAEEGGYFSLIESGRPGTIYIVDEVSMIGHESTGNGHNIADDLISHVRHTDGARLIVVGDNAQLPPVASDFSPFLSAEYMEEYYNLHVYQATLTDVVRQIDSSGILFNATAIRKTLTDRAGVSAISLNTAFPDTHAITGGELIDALETAYGRYGREAVVVICPSNKRAAIYNQGIRSRVFDYEEPLVRGERLVVSRNNYFFTKRRDKSDFLANGEIVEVRHLGRSHRLYGYTFIEASVYVEDRDEEVDVCIPIDGISTESAGMSQAERETFYKTVMEDYTEVSSVVERRRLIRSNPYWQALETKYAYAMTCHKAQGGGWPVVFADLGLLNMLPPDETMLRWLYTAVTRAEQELYLVNCPPAYMTGAGEM